MGLRVLVLCTGNSARSQMAEAILRHLSKGSVHVESAGTKPQAEIHPMARIAVQKLLNVEMSGHPKPVEQLAGQEFDFVITVCDQATETCPVFLGRSEHLHWNYEDPAAIVGTEKERQRAFDSVAQQLSARMRIWLDLPEIRSLISR
jgi:arsenate reductase